MLAKLSALADEDRLSPNRRAFFKWFERQVRAASSAERLDELVALLPEADVRRRHRWQGRPDPTMKTTITRPRMSPSPQSRAMTMSRPRMSPASDHLGAARSHRQSTPRHKAADFGMPGRHPCCRRVSHVIRSPARQNAALASYHYEALAQLFFGIVRHPVEGCLPLPRPAEPRALIICEPY